MIQGIDVSENQGYLPMSFWQEAVDKGIKFAYIRCSYGRNNVDEEFVHNVECAHAVGLMVGAYHYSYALNVEQARQEAEHCRKVIEDACVFLELPVFYDMEDADHYKAQHGFAFDAVEMTEMCRVFGDTLGLHWGVYSSLSWFENYIDWKYLGCPVWNAEWGNKDDIQSYVWQDSGDDSDFILGGHVIDHDWMYLEV